MTGVWASRLRMADVDRVPLIVDVIVAARGHTIADVYRIDRSATFVRTRQLVWSAVVDLTAFTAADIAVAFRRDATTIRHGITRVRTDGDQDERRDVTAAALAAIGRTQRAMREAMC